MCEFVPYIIENARVLFYLIWDFGLIVLLKLSIYHAFLPHANTKPIKGKKVPRRSKKSTSQLQFFNFHFLKYFRQAYLVFKVSANCLNSLAYRYRRE